MSPSAELHLQVKTSLSQSADPLERVSEFAVNYENTFKPLTCYDLLLDISTFLQKLPVMPFSSE